MKILNERFEFHILIMLVVNLVEVLLGVLQVLKVITTIIDINKP